MSAPHVVQDSACCPGHSLASLTLSMLVAAPRCQNNKDARLGTRPFVSHFPHRFPLKAERQGTTKVHIILDKDIFHLSFVFNDRLQLRLGVHKRALDEANVVALQGHNVAQHSDCFQQEVS